MDFSLHITKDFYLGNLTEFVWAVRIKWKDQYQFKLLVSYDIQPQRMAASRNKLTWQ